MTLTGDTDPAAIAEAIQRCDQPDLVIRIAFQDADHRKFVIARAASAVNVLRSELLRTAIMFSPWPNRINSVQIWAEGDEGSPMVNKVAAGAIAFQFANALVGLVGVLLWWNDHTWSDGRTLAYLAAVAVLTAVLGPVVRRFYGWAYRRQTAHLDEMSALEIVVACIKKLAARNPSRVPWLLWHLHGAYDDLLPMDGKPDVFRWPDMPLIPLGRRRSWAATFDSYDQAREVCYYRMQYFTGRQRAESFMAEIPAAFKTFDTYGRRLREVQKLLTPIAKAGKTNTSFVGPIT